MATPDSIAETVKHLQKYVKTPRIRIAIYSAIASGRVRTTRDEVHQPSHIDYVLVSKRSVSAIKAFGVTAPADLMVDYDHSILFCDLDVTQLLELGERKPAATLPQWHKSQIRYSDKKRVARFRKHATDL